MSKSQHPKKHHFVPQVYLKSFYSEGKLFALDITKVKKGYNEVPQKRTTGQICYFNDYYTINDDLAANQQFRLDAYDALHIEVEVFRRLENRYPSIIKGMLAAGKISLDDSVDLADFILQIKLRNPYWMKNVLEKFKDQFIDQSIDGLMENEIFYDLHYPEIPIELRVQIADSVRNENKSNPLFSKQFQLYSLIQRNNRRDERNEKFRLALVDCKWMLYKAPKEGPYFITSDNPGYSLKNDDGLAYNTNFAAPFLFFFPISPLYCLVVSDTVKDFAYSKKTMFKDCICSEISSDFVVFINNSTIKIVNSLLIGKDDWYLSQIARINNPNLKA